MAKVSVLWLCIFGTGRLASAIQVSGRDSHATVRRHQADQAAATTTPNLYQQYVNWTSELYEQYVDRMPEQYQNFLNQTAEQYKGVVNFTNSVEKAAIEAMSTQYHMVWNASVAANDKWVEELEKGLPDYTEQLHKVGVPSDVTDRISAISETYGKKMNETMSDCLCLGWKDAFESHKADCEMLGKDMCDGFLKKLPNTVNKHTRCLNMYPGAFMEQWCYVSDKCKEALPSMWAHDPFSSAKYKSCSFNHAQRRFAMLPIKMVRDLATDLNISQAAMAAWTYPSFSWDLYTRAGIGLGPDNWKEDGVLEETALE